MLGPVGDIHVEEAGGHDEHPDAQVDGVQYVVEEQGLLHSGDQD